MQTCWFCEAEEADPDAAVRVTLQGEVLGVSKSGFEQRAIRYEARQVVVPRCAACQRAHRREQVASPFWGALLVGGVAAGFLLNQALPARYPRVMGPCVGALAGLGVLLLLMRLLKRADPVHRKALSARIDHPDVKRLTEQGWKYLG